MKKIIAIIVIVFNLSFYAQTTTNGSFSYGGVNRTYKIYIPAAYDGTESVPLLLNLHGLGSNNTEQIAYGEFRPIADTANFIIILPQGTVGTMGGQTATHWNANYGTGVDDIGFLSALIDTISVNYNINENRIYSTGMSNGGFMSLTLAAQLSDKITAVASVTGTLSPLQANANTVVRPVPVMQIHGTSDQVVLYNGSAFQYVSVQTVLDFWIGHNHCDATAVVTQVPNTNTTDNSTATRYDYLNGDSGAEVVHYKITGGSHTWPGALALPNKVTNRDFDASTEIWKFFSKYEKSSLVTVEEIINEESWIELRSQNPSDGALKLASLNNEIYSITVLNMEGKEVVNSKNNIGETIINLEGLSNGNYIVKVANDSQVATLKILKK